MTVKLTASDNKICGLINRLVLISSGLYSGT